MKFPVWVADPLESCDARAGAFLESNKCNTSDSLRSAGNCGVEEHFRSLLENCDDGSCPNLSSVPLLNSAPVLRSGSSSAFDLTSMPPHCLVRYRGMVQDFFDIEFFAGFVSYDDGRSWNSGKFREIMNVKGALADVEPKVVEDVRSVLYVVSIPGECEWVSERVESPELEKISPRATDLEMSGSSRRKRARDSLESSELEMDVDPVPTDARKTRVLGEVASELVVARELVSPSGGKELGDVRFFDSNYPLSTETLADLPLPLPPCIVKLYDGMDDRIKLNDCVEFVGILDIDHREMCAPNFDQDDWLSEDRLAHHPPSSLVCRLHCLTFYPLLPSILKPPSSLSFGISELRRRTIDFIASFLGGDTVAADYMLLTALSSVYRRLQFMPVGKITSNLSFDSAGVGPIVSLGAVVSRVMHLLFSKAVYFPLSIRFLNEKPFVPYKDYEQNRLVSGPLQLSAGTVVVLDELAMDEGQLSETGVKNVRALREVTAFQRLDYSFLYDQRSFDIDIPVIILSLAKSMIVHDFRIPLLPHRPLATDPQNPGEVGLYEMRNYILLVRSLDWTSSQDNIAEIIQDELVAARREDPSVTADTFHLWLNLSRAMCQSRGETSLTMEGWNEMMSLERERRRRLNEEMLRKKAAIRAAQQ